MNEQRCGCSLAAGRTQWSNKVKAWKVSSSDHFNTGEMKQMQQPCLHAASGEHVPGKVARMAETSGRE